MRTTEMFAGPHHLEEAKPQPRLFHFYPHPKVVGFAGCKRVFRVRLTEVAAETDETYWSWWDLDNPDEPKFTLTYPKRLLLDMCFPAGIKGEESRSKGLALPVMVEILEEV